MALHQKGQLAQAQAIYEEILKAQPEHFDALHLLGVIASQTKHRQKVADLLGRAIDLKPNNPAFHSNHGIALQAPKRFDAGVATYDKAIAVRLSLAAVQLGGPAHRQEALVHRASALSTNINN